MKFHSIIIFFSLLTSCASAPKIKTENPPKLVSISPDISPFFIRQNITIISTETREIDAVVQYEKDEVTTAFLDPSGRPLVLLVQRGLVGKISGPWVDRIPFDLRWVMQVIGATWVLSPLTDNNIDGERTLESEIGPVKDYWGNGKIKKRILVKSNTTIQYQWGQSACPSMIMIKNSERAYELKIETTQCGLDK